RSNAGSDPASRISTSCSTRSALVGRCSSSRSGKRWMPTVPALLRAPRGEIGYLAFSVFVEDNRTFAVVLMIPPWERELRVLKLDAAYMAAALSMPSLVPWVHPDQADPFTPVLPMGSLQNLHRSFVVDGEPVAPGIQPIG